jgi:hypothetical protein
MHVKENADQSQYLACLPIVRQIEAIQIGEQLGQIHALINASKGTWPRALPRSRQLPHLYCCCSAPHAVSMTIVSRTTPWLPQLCCMHPDLRPLRLGRASDSTGRACTWTCHRYYGLGNYRGLTVYQHHNWLDTVTACWQLWEVYKCCR